MISKALRELHLHDNVTEAPSDCNESSSLWETGSSFFEHIRRQVLPDGVTGRVAFDSMGDRVNAEYRVVNLHRRTAAAAGRGALRSVEVGSYRYSNVSASSATESCSKTVKIPTGLSNSRE